MLFQTFYWVEAWRPIRPLGDLEMVVVELFCCLAGVFGITVMLEEPATSSSSVLSLMEGGFCSKITR